MINSTSNETLFSILKMDDREEAFYFFVDLYASVTEEERDYLRLGWPFDCQWVLPDFATLSWTIAGKKSARERIWAALVCICIICDGNDLRDHLVSVAAIHYHTRIIE